MTKTASSIKNSLVKAKEKFHKEAAARVEDLVRRIGGKDACCLDVSCVQGGISMNFPTYDVEGDVASRLLPVAMIHDDGVVGAYHRGETVEEDLDNFSDEDVILLLNFLERLCEEAKHGRKVRFDSEYVAKVY